MKTERMVLLVTPEEKARIGQGAATLGVSASEYIRKLVALVDADDVREIENVGALMPLLGEAIGNMEANIARTLAKVDEAERERAYRRTDDYRAKVRAELLADPTIDWDAMAALFGGSRPDAAEAAA